MSKKKLLVLLGAGSSVEQGMPSVADIDKLMTAWASEWDEDWVATSSSPYGGTYLTLSSNYFQALTKSVTAYYDSSNLRERWQPNFERILAEMASLAHWVAPPPSGNSLREIIGEVLEEYIKFEVSRPPSYEITSSSNYGPSRAVIIQLAYLLGRLANEIRSRSRTMDRNTCNFRRYCEILNALRDAFDVGIYNLNYDSVALAAWPEAFTGFDLTDGLFDPASVHRRTDWGFAYHLHGSVHHTLNSPEGPISWQSELGMGFNDGGADARVDSRTDGRHFPVTSLVAGGFKLDQMLSEPFHSLHCSLTRHVYEADAVLVGGYGFGDIHINRALQNCLYYMRPDDRPPVVVLTLSSPSALRTELREDAWARNLRISLLGGSTPSSQMQVQDRSIASLIKDGQIEVIASERCGIWHGGFTSCVARIDSIIAWLDGDRAAFR